jgi:hypothetical protein
MVSQGILLDASWQPQVPQDYLKHYQDSPYIRINDLPKIAGLQKQFPQLYREY